MASPNRWLGENPEPQNLGVFDPKVTKIRSEGIVETSTQIAQIDVPKLPHVTPEQRVTLRISIPRHKMTESEFPTFKLGHIRIDAFWHTRMGASCFPRKVDLEADCAQIIAPENRGGPEKNAKIVCTPIFRAK